MTLNLRSGFRLRLQGPPIVVVPGVADVLTALIVEREEFEAVYVSGAGVANSQLGVPDIGLSTMDDTLQVARAVAGRINRPVIADVDTGYGNALNVYRTVQEFERAGVAAVQLEDQIAPKRCGHFDDHGVVSQKEMIEKLKAAQEARVDPDLLIIARTDGISALGLSDALERAAAYRDAGADAVFVEAPRSVSEMEIIGRELAGIPLVANMVEGGKSPILPAEQLESFGFSMVLYANLALRAAAFGAISALRHLAVRGSSIGIEHQIISMDERQKLVQLDKYDAIAQAFAP